MHYPPIQSEQKDFAASQRVEFADFVLPRGPRGGRNVIDGFYVRIFGTITVADANWDGRDVPRLIDHLAVETRSGRQRWSLSGYKTRMASIRYNGIERHNEHADVAIGAAQAVDLLLYVPMAKRKVRRGKDFALPADVFRKIVINFASLATAGAGAATLSAADLDCYILADCHEENSVEIKAEDSVKSINFTSTTQVVAKFNGAVHDMDIVRENDTLGGAVITAITTVRCDELGLPPVNRVDLVRHYQQKNGAGTSGTTNGAARFQCPIDDGMCLPIFAADQDTKLWDGKVVEQAIINLGAGAADYALMTREVLPKSEADFNAQAATFGIDPRSLRMKTDGKTRRSLSSWGRREKAVGVWSAPLKD